MFQLFSRGGRNCDEVTRRDALRVGSLAGLGFSFAPFRRAWAEAAIPALDVSCITIWLQGGISHIDSFDPKPDAPAAIRGEFGVIQTRVPGIQVCEPLPRLARHMDKFSILRSLNPRNGTHGVADATMLTGHPFNPALAFPSFGSVVAKEKGDRNSMPPYVQLGTALDRVFGGGAAGFLGDRYNPFVLPTDGSNPLSSVRDARMTGGCDREPAPPAKEAFAIASQDGRTRDRYGRHPLGTGCLRARRLIEAGVRFVTVTDGSWDTHVDNFQVLRDRLLPRLDSALSALLQDLEERGRLESTLVVVLSDFGRSPKVNSSAGRDHWSTAGIALLAGGGIRPGTVVGRTDALGGEPAEAPYFTEDLAATIYHCLGIAPETTHHTPVGRPVPILDGGRPIRELV